MAERLGPPLDEPVFGDVAIIGIGLIGSSLARAIRQQNAARRIVIADASREVLARAEALGSGMRTRADLADAVRNADCVILCAPVGANARHWPGDRTGAEDWRDRVRRRFGESGGDRGT